jgi:hypothetical protein
MLWTCVSEMLGGPLGPNLFSSTRFLKTIFTEKPGLEKVAAINNLLHFPYTLVMNICGRFPVLLIE